MTNLVVAFRPGELYTRDATGGKKLFDVSETPCTEPTVIVPTHLLKGFHQLETCINGVTEELDIPDDFVALCSVADFFLDP